MLRYGTVRVLVNKTGSNQKLNRGEASCDRTAVARGSVAVASTLFTRLTSLVFQALSVAQGGEGAKMMARPAC